MYRYAYTMPMRVHVHVHVHVRVHVRVHVHARCMSDACPMHVRCMPDACPMHVPCSSQDMAHSSDMGESCGLLPSPPQHRGGRRDRHRAAASVATGSAATGSAASGSRRSVSGSRTRGGEGEYSGQTLQSLGLKKTELMAWLARWERDFEREHRRHVASGLLGYMPCLLAVGYIPPLLAAPQLAAPASRGGHAWLWAALRTLERRPCRFEPE